MLPEPRPLGLVVSTAAGRTNITMCLCSIVPRRHALVSHQLYSASREAFDTFLGVVWELRWEGEGWVRDL